MLEHKDVESSKGRVTRRYLVAWRGSPHPPTWEPARNLANAAGHVQTYLKSEKYVRSVSDEPTPVPAPLPAPLALPVVPEVPMAEQLLVASGTRASKRRERRRVLAAAIASW